MRIEVKEGRYEIAVLEQFTVVKVVLIPLLLLQL